LDGSDAVMAVSATEEVLGLLDEAVVPSLLHAGVIGVTCSRNVRL